MGQETKADPDRAEIPISFDLELRFDSILVPEGGNPQAVVCRKSRTAFRWPQLVDDSLRPFNPSPGRAHPSCRRTLVAIKPGNGSKSTSDDRAGASLSRMAAITDAVFHHPQVVTPVRVTAMRNSNILHTQKPRYCVRPARYRSV